MADALCGPANPLQNLQKHTQVDRTLQQDRLVGARNSPGQGFRTADPRAGSLDADLHAFENGFQSPFQFQQPFFMDASPGHVQQNQPTLGGWATDFQRLNLNEQQPVPAHHFRTEAPLVTSTTGGWHTEFMRQRSSSSTPVSLGKQAVREPIMSNYTPASQSMMMNHYQQPMFSQQSTMFQGQDSHAQQQQHQQRMMEEQARLDDLKFEAAFAEAAMQAQEMDLAREQDDPSSEAMLEPAEKIKIGADSINYREWKDRSVDQDARDADELARTAGQLLTSVQHDTSEKFQRSTFFDLMRRIRDREVEVQNNDLTDVATGAAVSGTPTTTVASAPVLESHHPSSTSEHMTFTPAQQESSSHFAFPDMDVVYAPEADAAETVDHAQPTFPPHTSFGFDGNQYPPPHTQMHALHPGGKYYPEQSPWLGRVEPEMSGAAVDGDGSAISASDFDYVEESAGLAKRFREVNA